LDHRQTLPIIPEKQTTNLQGNFENGMELWNRAMGMRFTIKHSKNPEIPVQTFKAYNKRTGSLQIKRFTKTSALRK
jgi:uncharacterized protein with LGFP repeats